jgi:hypothetical protein
MNWLSAEAAEKLVQQLMKRFPAAALMDAFGIIYPQHWQSKKQYDNFDQHLKILKNQYGISKPFNTAKNPEGMLDPMVSSASLDMQTSLFKQCMCENAASMMKWPFKVNHVTRMWLSIDSKSFLCYALSEYVKLADPGICMVLGSVQDERTFSTITFLKTRVRNKLTTHLSLIMGMKTRPFFSIDSFPYDVAYNSWRDACKRHGDTDWHFSWHFD